MSEVLERNYYFKKINWCNLEVGEVGLQFRDGVWLFLIMGSGEVKNSQKTFNVIYGQPLSNFSTPQHFHSNMFVFIFCFILNFLEIFNVFQNLSDYARKVNMTDPYKWSALSSSGVGSAVWKLTLALIFKMIITVFTFGIKVCYLTFQLPGQMRLDKIFKPFELIVFY